MNGECQEVGTDDRYGVGWCKGGVKVGKCYRRCRYSQNRWMFFIAP